MVDTNLIVSGTVTTSTIPYSLLEAWRKGEYILVTSPSIIKEVEEVLKRPEKKFSITNRQIKKAVETLVTKAFVTPGTLEVDVVKNDPDDNELPRAYARGIRRLAPPASSFSSASSSDLRPRYSRSENKFVACAIEGSASHIVSGDKHLLDIDEYQGIKIVRARNFLESVRAATKPIAK